MDAYLGIDVSKGYADFLLLDKGKINWMHRFSSMIQHRAMCL